MVDLAKQLPVSAGIQITWTALAASTTYSLENNGSTILLVRHTDAASANDNAQVTLVTEYTDDGLALADRVVAVTKGTVKAIGGLDRGVYNKGAFVSFTASGTDLATNKVEAAVLSY